MNIKILNQSILDFDGDLIIVNLFEGVKIPGGATGAVDKALHGVITEMIKNEEITGKLGETIVFPTFGKIKPGKVMVVGLGRSDKFGIEEIRKASGSAAMAAKKAKAKKVGTILHGAGIGGIEPEIASQALAEGTILALYEFNVYKKTENKRIEEFFVVETDKSKIEKIKKGIYTGSILAESQNIARDFTNEPANNLTPEKFEKKVKEIIKDLGLAEKIKITVMDKKEIERLKMGALLAVAQGSDNEPRFIVLRYENSKGPLISLIGKTVTFDSGGISLKPSEGMGAMKGDMTGGGVVFATTVALARADVKINLLTIIPAVENMPSGSASRPGDIVRAMNGKTIEIISTDAEGRLTLADAICYAEKEGAETIVDIATLTGGCAVAFGDVTAAVMGNDQALIDQLLMISKDTGERMWQLPLFEEYEEKMKSDVADIKNSGGRLAAPITAGIFIKYFVEKAKWIHIDIASKEFSEKDRFYQPKGATGFGVRTLFEFCTKLKL
ncbi:MAG: leucyl aminopeptidase [candidate division WOR-3 bacterium]|nr:leucyl aminopeptidase [candidate division WOR-3 bacterium]